MERCLSLITPRAVTPAKSVGAKADAAPLPVFARAAGARLLNPARDVFWNGAA
ncbi:hypothetical protein [Tateyamaria sp. SN3-11]|uniref:hypothetical protein n=1 Tax=Tateyamaria sp. SN3-11 TaxID=3092147 RepID=UPI0039EAA71B